MELWANGFNAWGQLDLGEVQEGDPRDLKEFKCLLSDPHIEVLWTSLSAILIKTSSSSRIAGFPDDLTNIVASNEQLCGSLAVASNGRIVRKQII